MLKKVLTLCIIHDGNRILLGMKKRGFGKGKWNGFGGKVEQGETIEAGTMRELKEEAGVEVESLIKMGVMEFVFEGDETIHQVHTFKGRGVRGVPIETEEMKPQWFEVSEMPFNDMWPSDIYWMPYFLEGKQFKGKVAFTDDKTVLAADVKEIVG